MQPRTYLIVVLGLAAALVRPRCSRSTPASIRTASPRRSATTSEPRVAGRAASRRVLAQGARPCATRCRARSILGTSRAEFGIDPRHPGFASEYAPVLNLSLGGLSIEQMRLLLIHANTVSPLRAGGRSASTWNRFSTTGGPISIRRRSKATRTPSRQRSCACASASRARRSRRASRARLVRIRRGNAAAPIAAAASAPRTRSSRPRAWRIPDGR